MIKISVSLPHGGVMLVGGEQEHVRVDHTLVGTFIIIIIVEDKGSRESHPKLEAANFLI